MRNIHYKFILILSILSFIACEKPENSTAENPEKNNSAKTDSTNFEPKELENAIVYTTAENTDLRLTQTDELTFEPGEQAKENEISIFVNPDKTFQEFLGIGGAITDASAEVFAKLSPENQQKFLDAYYSESGIDYNIVRTTIHSCDFSSGSYTYIDEGDKELNTFSIEHDKEFRLPLIKKAQNLIKDDMVFYVSPWSPPAFMKTNNNMLQGGKLKPEFYESWANYYVKFINAYEAEGLPVWGLTIQNEPMATQTWESCIYTAEEERDFLKNHLGPTLEKAGMGDKNIVIWDHNRDLIVQRANTILDDPEAAKYVWGVGFHWYETWTKADPAYKNLGLVNESYPDVNLLFTEGCQEKFDAAEYQRWSNAERYGDSMINDFNNGTVGWTDWNILLDEKGGPNHVGNFCFAPVHADTTQDELILTPSYYYIGHFSKFIKPGAKRVSTSSSRSTLQSTSFRNPDGKIISIVMNTNDKAESFNFYVEQQKISMQIPAHGIQTIVY